MTNLKCDAVNCGYNCSGLCCRENICVDGDEACECSETCCGDFSGKARADAQDARKGTDIACSAGNCRYNDCGGCVKDDVCISGNTARKPHDTCCGDFRM